MQPYQWVFFGIMLAWIPGLILLAWEALSRPAELPATLPVIRASATGRDGQPPFRCPLTGYRCEGDLSHLCPEYGCARKAGLSPRSDENY